MDIRQLPRSEARILEREIELSALEDALASGRTGSGVLLILEGEPGIGKSALLQAAAEAALESDMQVLRARAGELERQFPFGCVLQLFEHTIREASAAERRRLLSGAAAHAAPLFEAAPDDAQPGQLFSILHGLFWLTSLLAGQRPLLVCLDDAHWADSPSLRFLLYLAQRLADLPAVVAVTARPAEPGAEDDLLPRLRGHPSARVIRPQPLPREAVELLIGEQIGEPDAAFTSACAAAVGGNPFLLHELLVALAAEGHPPTAQSVDAVADTAPAPVQRALTLALSRLPPAATTLARAAAVLGDQATVSAAAELAVLQRADVVEQAAALRAAEILADRAEIRFAHPILRSSLYHELTKVEQAHAHARAAAILGREGLPPDQVAPHILKAPPIGEPWVVETLRAAATRAAAQGLPQVAATLLRRAREEPLAEDEAGELTLALARTEAAAGAPEAVERLKAALEIVGEPRQRAEILRDIGRLAYAQGRFSEAAEALAEALRHLPPDAEELALSLRAERAAAALWAPDGGVAVADDLGALLDSGRKPRTQAERTVMATLAGVTMLRGTERGVATSLATRAWDDGAFLLGTSAEDPALPGLTGALLPADEFAAARTVANATLDDARARGSVLGFATGSFMRASTWVLEGRPREAAADAEAAVAGWSYGWVAHLPTARWTLCTARLELGDLHGARAALETEPEAEAATRQSAGYFGLVLARGLIALADRDYAQALEHFDEVAAIRRNLGTDNPAFLGWRHGAVRALLGLDRDDDARELASELVALARTWGAPRTVAVALRTQAQAEPDGRALALLEEAAATLEHSPAQLELARTLVELGARLRRERKRGAARDPLRRALDLADGVGGIAVAERARRELVATGARPRRASLTGPGALTPQELQVARMAADGLTNREIAEGLFVTIKAVKWHLGNAYAKLGISSRRELPAAFAEPEQR